METVIPGPSTIAPYEDPAFGKRPMYDPREFTQRTKDMMLQEDANMADVYEIPTESDEGEGEGEGEGDTSMLEQQ